MPSKSGDACVRCTRLSTQCVFISSRQGRRTDLRVDNDCSSNSGTESSMDEPSMESFRAGRKYDTSPRPTLCRTTGPYSITHAAIVDDSDTINSSADEVIDDDDVPNNNNNNNNNYNINNNNNIPDSILQSTTNNTRSANSYSQYTPLLKHVLNSRSTAGQRSIYRIIPGTNTMRQYDLPSRVKYNEECNDFAVIESSQLLNKQLKRNCENLLIVYGIFCEEKECYDWYLGIIASLAYRTQTFEDDDMNEFDGQLKVRKWTGECVYVGGGCIPKLFLAEDEQSALKELTLVTLDFNDKNSSNIKVKFVNQFSGSLPINGKMAPDLVNVYDGCLQCSPNGSDIYPLKFRQIKTDRHLKAAKAKEVTEDDTEHTAVIQQNRNTKKRMKAINAAAASTKTENDNEDVIRTNKPLKFLPKQKSLTSVAVVTHSNGNPLTLAEATSIDSTFEKKYFIPDPIDYVNETTIQKVYAVDKEQYATISKHNKNGIEYDKVVSMLVNNSTATITTVCINVNSQFDDEHDYQAALSQIFAGNSAPDVTNNVKYTKVHNKQLNRTIYYALVSSHELQSYTSLSTSLVDNRFHAFKIESQHVNTFNKTFTTAGTYPGRNGGRGHNTYVGNKNTESQSIPNANEGPKMKQEMRLHRQTTNTLYYPRSLHLLTALATTIFTMTSIFHKPIDILLDRNYYQLFTICIIHILTTNYYNFSHVDTGDRCSTERKDKAVKRAQAIVDCPHTVQQEKNRFKNFIKFVNDYGLSVHTTCGMQLVPTEEGKLHPDARIYVCQAFLMLGLGMTIRMPNYISHTFMGGVFQHCTCVPVIIVDGMVFFGKHPYITIVNWGAGNNDTPEEKARKKAEREAERQRKKRNKERDNRQRKRARGNNNGR